MIKSPHETGGLCFFRNCFGNVVKFSAPRGSGNGRDFALDARFCQIWSGAGLANLVFDPYYFFSNIIGGRDDFWLLAGTKMVAENIC